jgi:membrane protein
MRIEIIAPFVRAGRRFSLDGCAFLAQALAFNAVFAMFPLLLLAIAGLGFIYGTDAGQARVLDTVGKLAPALVDVTRENLANVVAFRSVSSIFSVIALWWSSKNFFLGLRYALNRALGLVSTRPFVLEVLWSLIAVPVAGGLLAVASFEPLIVSHIVSIYGSGRAVVVSQIISNLTALVLVFLVTLVFYNKLPARKYPSRFGLPGAIFCGLSWAIIQFVFTEYTSHVSFYHIYGAVSAILALLFWFYLMGITFLYGAELCATYEEDREAALGEIPMTASSSPLQTPTSVA